MLKQNPKRECFHTLVLLALSYINTHNDFTKSQNVKLIRKGDIV